MIDQMIIQERILDSYVDIISNLKIINIDRCPPIWSGKKWALHNGIKQSKGKLIFADRCRLLHV